MEPRGVRSGGLVWPTRGNHRHRYGLRCAHPIEPRKGTAADD
jgi:hypothetical protein